MESLGGSEKANAEKTPATSAKADTQAKKEAPVMARVYRPPVFNVQCAVWHNELPHDLAAWNGLRPSRSPDIVSACQLYLPRWTTGLSGHALLNSATETHLRSGFQELRLPKGTMVRTRWGVAEGIGWELSALVEVPLASGRFYVGCIAEIRHVGFPNEYNAVFLAQLSNAGGAGPMASGSGMQAGNVLAIVPERMATGSAILSDLITVATVPHLHSGSRLAVVVLSPLYFLPMTSGSDMTAGTLLGNADQAVHSGSWLARLGTLAVATQQATSGSSMRTSVVAPDLSPDMASGSDMEGGMSSGGGGTTPGNDCNSAGELTLPYVANHTVGGGAANWFKFTVPADGDYRIKATRLSGPDFGMTGYTGTCAFLNPVIFTGGDPVKCGSNFLTTGTVIRIEIANGFGTDADYELDVAAGTC